MTAIHIPLDKQTVHVPVREQARFTVPRDMVHRQYNRVRIGEMSTLWPEDQFRKETIYWAKKFIEIMAKQGKELMGAEVNMVVLGPYRHRKFGGSPSTPAIGRAFGEDPYPDLADFVLEAEFLADRVHMVEYRIPEEDHASRVS